MVKKKVLVYILFFLIGALAASFLPFFFSKKTEVNHLYPSITKSEMIQRADLIVKGRFVGFGEPYLFKVEAEDGAAEYEYLRAEFQITEVLSGTPYNNSVVEIRLSSNTGQATGEYTKERNHASLKASEKIFLTEDFSVSSQEEEEYLLILNRQEEGSAYKEAGNYYVLFRNEGGVYSLKGEGWSNPQNDFAFKDSSLKEEIQTSLSRVSE